MTYRVALDHPVDFAGWRDAARRLAGAGVPPADIAWSVEDTPDLFAGIADSALPEAPIAPLAVPRAFLALAETVIRANDPERFALLYDLLRRLQRGEPHLLEISTDRQVARANLLARSVSHDMHKMRAFLRFRAVAHEGGTHYVAWFEPEHYIVEANAGFFQRRFTTMEWFILTPYRSLHWDGATLHQAPGADKSLLPEDDRFADYWNTYFASIFNPARLKVKTMTTHMARKYWTNMPETALIPALQRNAPQRTAAMIQAGRSTAHE
jgi:DNA polymerase